ncbi:hypothetical protein ACFQ4M_00875 [Thauera mechernichensis]|uniref:Apea-like HEPN domain-containing protein n=1 Tax=Thauera mechernichensis TaxID=82788 RepID=A0ABW3WAJ8_9RHOO|nr:hypothetical protein [Thauera mechernichensis]MDG3064499.1 hypothetical protein [Thauera mechernichensis]
MSIDGSHEDAQAFLNFISSYEFINDHGRLDLEAFCFYLWGCFEYDGIPSKSPQPRDVYDLLLVHIESAFDEKDFDRYVQRQRLVDWTPEAAGIYPDKVRTYIHCSALLEVGHDWIYDIGYRLMGVAESAEPAKYFAWVDDEWTYVFTYINRYHNQFFDFLKRMDLRIAEGSGCPSMFEALHHSLTSKTSFDDAHESIQRRREAEANAQERVRQAMASGFFLEAITLQECLISNCLTNYLRAKQRLPKEVSLHSLVQAVLRRGEQLSPATKRLFKDVDVWRQARNTAIHGFVTCQANELANSQDQFLAASEETASSVMQKAVNDPKSFLS